MSIELFWENYLNETNQKDISYFESFSFGLGKETANELLKLVLSGKKTATASSILAYHPLSNRMPQIGDLSIVTDGDGNPRCIIETLAITILPFHKMTFDICKREGEDEVLETWQENHRKFFKEEGKMLGYTFKEDMLVVFEDFKVVYKK